MVFVLSEKRENKRFPWFVGAACFILWHFVMRTLMRRWDVNSTSFFVRLLVRLLWLKNLKEVTAMDHKQVETEMAYRMIKIVLLTGNNDFGQCNVTAWKLLSKPVY
jgi:hypothetical protein